MIGEVTLTSKIFCALSGGPLTIILGNSTLDITDFVQRRKEPTRQVDPLSLNERSDTFYSMETTHNPLKRLPRTVDAGSRHKVNSSTTVEREENVTDMACLMQHVHMFPGS